MATAVVETVAETTVMAVAAVSETAAVVAAEAAIAAMAAAAMVETAVAAAAEAIAGWWHYSAFSRTTLGHAEQRDPRSIR